MKHLMFVAWFRQDKLSTKIEEIASEQMNKCFQKSLQESSDPWNQCLYEASAALSSYNTYPS